jgi:hypothetical protein
MSSLAEANQLLARLDEIEKKLAILLSRRDDLNEMRVATVELDYLLRQAMSLMNQLGVAEGLTTAYFRIMRVVTALNALQTAMIAIQLGAGPLGWMSLALGGAGLIGAFGSLFSAELQDDIEVVRTH